ncbi:DUF4198 domain-containing protein [Calycomorphotria hydatis]|uniref:Carboxypeptidase regulatory-like domain-containing protein n=1 Tax=Calycomorphotria hydatis TaxID=2528027 RepID=A0A517T5E9_9PLAN|nr:DUF4198 domain-containing protein [Calycomorphotria hydatis]QDT63603.1 hypothetical protein V22_08270 [Calycomorphotria hydatis]
MYNEESRDYSPVMKAGTVLVACLAIFLAWKLYSGKSEKHYAPVNGVIMLDGKPLRNAKLVFEPIGNDKGETGGRPSFGVTDDEGRFSLQSPVEYRTGAVVGNHRVRVLTGGVKPYTIEQREEARKILEEEEIKSGGAIENVTEEKIMAYLSDHQIQDEGVPLPEKYNVETELTFTVPPDGSTDANFSLDSKGAK